MLILPHREIEGATLDALLEEIVTRDGTDYGEHELSLESRLSRLRGQLDSGLASLCYDSATETCNVLPTEEAKRLVSHVVEE